MATETMVTLRGEGGVEWTLSLPLSEAIEDQVRKGTLAPVDEESRSLLEEHLFADAEDGDGGEEWVEEISVSPAAAKLAEDHGIDLEQVEGTGKEGSITKADVQAAIDAEDGDGR